MVPFSWLGVGEGIVPQLGLGCPFLAVRIERAGRNEHLQGAGVWDAAGRSSNTQIQCRRSDEDLFTPMQYTNSAPGVTDQPWRYRHEANAAMNACISSLWYALDCKQPSVQWPHSAKAKALKIMFRIRRRSACAGSAPEGEHLQSIQGQVIATDSPCTSMDTCARIMRMTCTPTPCVNASVNTHAGEGEDAPARTACIAHT